MTNHSQLFPDKKEKIDFGIAITVILVFLAAIIYYLYGPEKRSNTLASGDLVQTSEEAGFNYADTKEVAIVEDVNKNPKEEQIRETTAVKTETSEVLDNNEPATNLSSTSEEETNQENATNSISEKVPPVYVEEEEAETNESLPYEEPGTEEPEESPTPTVEEPEEEGSVESEPEEPATDEVTEPTKPAEAVEEIASTNNNIKLESSDQDRTYGCIIIIGSFKEQKNAKLLVQKIEKQNYPVYEGIYKGYYIVGVNSDCSTKKITPLLRKMRRDYEESAWVYKRE